MPNVTIHPNRVSNIPVLAAVVDGYPDERHMLRTETGDEQLEDGAEITDHAVARKRQLVLTGWVSNLTEAGNARPGTAWARILEINQAVEPVTVVTPWGLYPEMMLMEADAENRGGAMRFTLRLAEVQRVGVQTGSIGDEAGGPAADRTSEVTRGRVISPTAAPPPSSPGFGIQAESDDVLAQRIIDERNAAARARQEELNRVAAETPGFGA